MTRETKLGLGVGSSFLSLVAVVAFHAMNKSDEPPPPPEVPAPEGTVPHWLPGTNPNLRDFAKWYGLPFEATRGGAETLYPEYRSKLRDYKPPEKCERYCACTTLIGAGCNVPPPRPQPR